MISLSKHSVKGKIFDLKFSKFEFFRNYLSGLQRLNTEIKDSASLQGTSKFVFHDFIDTLIPNYKKIFGHFCIYHHYH